jgi:hypothetical protein
LSSKFGEEPDLYKILVYNQLTADEVEKANLPVEKLIYWDITASLPGKNPTDAPHVTVYWYGPNVSTEKGKVIHMKSVKLDPKYTDTIRSIVARKVGGSESERENGVEFKDFTMKTDYREISELAKAIESSGKLSIELSLEFGKVTKQEKQSSSFPKTKILGEKALET